MSSFRFQPRFRRRFQRRAVVVLAAFAMTIVVTLLAPFVRPVAYELVCSAHGVRVVATDASGAQVDTAPGDAHGDSAAHCPLCMPAGVPPGVVVWDASPVQPLAHVRQSIPAARLAGLVGAPLPARGPPSFA